MASPKKLQYCVDGEWKTSKSSQSLDVWNPSTGEVLAQTPCCTADEIHQAIASAHAAFPAWKATPVVKRVQVLYKFRDLLDQHMEELVKLCSTEHGKILEESRGDLLKVKEPVELACGTPSLMMGESLMNTSTGFDTVLYREPLGVFVGLAPFNFPGMIPMGWMMPLCIATGNTLVLKASNATPMTSMRLLELLYEAGLPKGVVNLLTTHNDDAHHFLTHPDVKGVSFVGSTAIGLKVYSQAAAHGKRVQAQCEAKNHALVLDDANLEGAARAIINSAFGCAGERCMALPVVVAQEGIADQLTALIAKYASELKVGPGYEPSSELGPVVNEARRQSILKWIDTGLKEGAKLVLDGRGLVVKGYEKGFYLGPTILDHVKPGMSVGDIEIFGPVVCIKRVKTFEEGLAVMNANEFANGSIIFTQSGYYSREFALRTDAGMVGVNVGIPVPVGMFPFSGHKKSFFGDLHVLGKDGVRFFTESKVVTTKWFHPEDTVRSKKVDTWEGSIAR